MIIELNSDFKKEVNLLNDEYERNLLDQLVTELKKNHLDQLVPYIGVEHADYLNGGWCIYKDNGYWLVYHSERFIKSNLSIFTSIVDAVNFYLWSRLATPKNNNASVGMIYYSDSTVEDH